MACALAYKGCFRAADDSGRSELIDVYQMIDDSPHGRRAALTLLRTTDGKPVHRRSRGEYEIAGTATVLHSIDINCV